MYQDIDAERSVIGVMLSCNGQGSIIANAMTLSADDFTNADYRSYFAAARELYRKGVTIDIVSLGNQARDMGVEVTAKRLLQIAAYTPTTANHKTYIKAVRDCADRRKIRDIAATLATKIEYDDINAACYEAVRQLNNGNVSGASWLTMGEIMMRAFDRIDKISRGELQPIRTGIASLDRIFGGFYPGELTIVAARPSVGKSAFALYVAMQAAAKGKKVAFVSREMSPESIANRLMSQYNPLLRGEKLRDATFTDDEWITLGDAINSLSKNQIYTIYTARTMEDLNTEVRSISGRIGGIDLLMIDYAQLMHMNREGDSRVEELEAISGAMKELAMSLQIPVLALAQVKRSGARVAVMPTMDELKGSGAFEQDADNIILLHRPESEADEIVEMRNDKATFHELLNSGKQYIAIKIAKQRQGEVGGTVAAYDPAHNTYTSIGRGK